MEGLPDVFSLEEIEQLTEKAVGIAAEAVREKRNDSLETERQGAVGIIAAAIITYCLANGVRLPEKTRPDQEDIPF